MRTSQITLLLGGLLLLNACKKTEYSNTSTTTQPVFYFNGFINGSPINIQAGVNNYYMSTSYAKDSEGIYNYIGEFTTTGHPSNYPNSLEISFNDNSQSPSTDPHHIDTVITLGYYSYSVPIGMASAYSIQLSGFSNQSPSYYWNFGDGQTGSGNSPTHIYSHPGVYTIILHAISGSYSCYDTSDIIVGQVGNAFASVFSGKGFTGSGLQTQFQVPISVGVPPYIYSWNFGDPYSGSSNIYANTSYSDTATHKFSSQGVYYVSVTTTDATGYTDKQSMNISTNYATGLAANFYVNTRTPVTNIYNLNDVCIKWYDNLGTLWSSENNKQSMKSLFQVTSVAGYMNNTAGQATKIITANINCKLYTAGNDSIPINGNVVFSVAHF